MSSTTTFVAPTGDAALLAIAMGKAQGINPLPPGFIPPSLTDPNYVVVNRGSHVTIVACIITVFTIFSVLMRLWINFRGLGWKLEDWLMVPALTFCCLTVANSIWAVERGGLGKHSWDVTYQEVKDGLIAFYLHLILYLPAVTLSKISVLLFVKRLALLTSSKRFIIFIDANLAFLIIWNLLYVLLFIFQCLPVKANYTLDLRFHPDTKCLNYLPAYFLGSTVHAFSDFVLLAIPVKLVWGLTMPPRKKVLVIGMLTLGLLACICSLVRMGYILNYTKATDLTWDGYEPSIWGILEATLATIAACTPALKGVMMKALSLVMGSTKKPPVVGSVGTIGSPAKRRVPGEANWMWWRSTHTEMTGVTGVDNVEMQARSIHEIDEEKVDVITTVTVDAASRTDSNV